MPKKTVDNLDPAGKRVLMRADFNVPLDESGKITDDRRIKAAMPTIRKILSGKGRLILMSHLGRPDGKPSPKYSLKPVALRLSELLGQPVKLAPDCVGEKTVAAANALKDGECLLLENVRFHAEEEIKDKNAKSDPALRQAKDDFARQIAEMGDAYVNDAFGTCHRDNATMLTVPQMMKGKPRVVGYLIQRELRFLGDALNEPARPFVVLLGGAKVSDKIKVIERLLEKCDHILIGGAMAYTFMAADGVATGSSRVEKDFVGEARRLKELGGSKLELPCDSVVAAKIEEGVETQVAEGPISDGLMGLDIGPKTIERYDLLVSSAKTILWNGPMGVFETPPFDRGTIKMAEAAARATDRGAVSVIGGGDSAAAVEAAGLAERMKLVSTGGGASLEYLEGKPFAALDVLDEA